MPSSAQHHREWVIKRKAEIVEEERRKEAERRRLERERLERLEKARIGRLLAQAKALREAEEFAPMSPLSETVNPRSTSVSVKQDFKTGRNGRSARRSIDPVLSGSFRTVQVDD